jgi:gamma-glutamyltranspeptidase / glutathione hydrolase
MGEWFAASSLAPVQAADTKEDEDNDNTLLFTSRRSPVVCRHACVATSQPLASSLGLDLLRKGANAADTAVAIAAALAVLEPCSTGLGGDMFCLYYNAKEKRVSAINGSGKSAQKVSMQLLKELYPNEAGDGISSDAFQFSANSVTVPGAARGWEDLIQKEGSGRFSLADLLEPAAVLAEEGFPVGPVTSHQWITGMHQITKWISPDDSVIPMTVDGTHGPKPGQVICNPDMARVLRELGSKGATDGFYNSATGRAIADAIQKFGGVLELEDLISHESLFPTPIFADYRGVQLWQVPPNGQGVAALVALSGLQALEESGKCPSMSAANIGTADAYHVMIEMMRLGFADARTHVACPDHSLVTTEWLLNKDRIGTRAEALFDPFKATLHGDPLPSSCTVSFQVVDQEGNAVSFVNSNYMGFGTGIVPDGCGFTLQNRGFGFTLDETHPNGLAGGKRPCHTIIPGMLTFADTGELYATMTNMGGMMQPQGHLQLMVDMVAGGMDPQAAIDLPRFCISCGTQSGAVQLEDGIPNESLKELERRGHKMVAGVSGHSRSVFGRAQIIKKDRENGVLWAGSDGRADGCAMGF